MLTGISFLKCDICGDSIMSAATLGLHPYNDYRCVSCDLNKYIESGVEELDQEKLPVLLTNKYHSLEDAKEILGEVAEISSLFIEFQQHLYSQKVA